MTLPFIARYRKEEVGNLSVEELRYMKSSVEELQYKNNSYNDLSYIQNGTII